MPFPEMTMVMAMATSDFVLSFLALVISYHVTVSRFSTPKQVSWVLTTITSGAMSLASMPFLFDFFTSGGSVQHIRTVPQFAVAVNRFFQAYLVADLVLGSIHYRSRISILEGWVHHSVYVLVVEVAIRRSWAHIFCLGAAMEIPTFVLGFTILYPRFRSNVLFACAFFLTRILFHIVLGISYFFEDNRNVATGGSVVPAIILASILPLHLMWFVGCIKGFVRRAEQKRMIPIPEPSVITLDIISAPVSEVQSVTPVSAPFPKAISTVKAYTMRYPLRLRLPARRQALRRAIRTLDVLQAKSAARWAVVSGSLYESLPDREKVFDSVGLGRRAPNQH